MNYRFCILSAVLVLSACANINGGQIQNVTVKTPGAQQAVCFLMVDRVRHKVSPPQTISIPKSKNPLIVDCRAPGNRQQKQVIKPSIENSTFGNVATGVVPGLAWDYFSESMFKFPDIIVVDFTAMPTKPEKLPAQNAPDIKQPEEYPLEEFRPGQPRMNSDRFEAPVQIKRREPIAPVSADTKTIIQSGGALADDKGNLQNAPLNNSYGPPVKIAPGQ
jgi:hypothetical protein